MWRWRKNHSGSEQDSTSIVDQGCALEGRLTFAGTLVLNGKFQGEIHSTGTLLIGETGEVQADMEVDVLIASGLVTGKITARERVQLKSKARIYGDMTTPVLVLEEGVVFDGHCKMMREGIRVAQKSS